MSNPSPSTSHKAHKVCFIGGNVKIGVVGCRNDSTIHGKQPRAVMPPNNKGDYDD